MRDSCLLCCCSSDLAVRPRSHGYRQVPGSRFHQHFLDARRLRYPVFVERSAGFESLVGDSSALPRVYLPEDYLRDVSGLNVVKTVWAEFLSDDPAGEVRWADELAQATGRPDGMIALGSGPRARADAGSLRVGRPRPLRPPASGLASDERAAALRAAARSPGRRHLAKRPARAPQPRPRLRARDLRPSAAGLRVRSRPLPRHPVHPAADGLARRPH
jgi:hypothetical protein